MPDFPNLEDHLKKYGDWWCESKGGSCDRVKLTQEETI